MVNGALLDRRTEICYSEKELNIMYRIRFESFKKEPVGNWEFGERPKQLSLP